MSHVKLVISLVLAGIVVLFVIQNVSAVEIKLLFWSVTMSRALLLFLVLVIGVVIGWLLHGYFFYRRRVTDTGDK